MRFRSALAVGVAVAAVLAGTSHAAPKMSCNLVVDPAGDVNNNVEVVPVPADEGLDVLGGDLATNGKSITGVFRLASEPGQPTWYTKRYIIQFSAPGLANPALLAIGISAEGNTFRWGYYGTSATSTSPGYNYPAGSTATGEINGKELRITASLADMSASEFLGPIKPGAKLSGISANSFRRIPPASPTGQAELADEASTKKAYTAGARSCVKVG